MSEPVDEFWTYQGYKMTVYSEQEEIYTENKKMKGKVPFYPTSILENAGATLEQSKAWKSNVVKDRELITGQNPMSDEKFIETFLKALSSN